MTSLRRRRRARFVDCLSLMSMMVSLSVAAAAQPATRAPQWSIDTNASLVAVVTHKEGLASGLAHEHLIVAPIEAIDLRFDPSEPETAAVGMDFEVMDLEVDDPERQQLWQQVLIETGVLAEPFADLSPKDRRKIRQSMLGPKQLDAEAHPTIRADVDRVRSDGGEASARLVFEVRGQSVERVVSFDAPLVDEGTLRITLTERFRFSDFGIRPYSALLGAIRVADEFDVVVRVVATVDG